MRRRYRYNPQTKQMEEINEQPRTDFGVLVCPDISPFKSIVDGSVVTGRRALREHNKRNNVTNPADFEGTWSAARKERDRMYSGDSSFDRIRRIERLREAYDKHSRRG